MTRPVRYFMIGALVFLMIYQHWTIQKINRHADSLIHQIEVEYGKRVDELDKVIIEKEQVEHELVEAEAQLTAIEQNLVQAQAQLSILGNRDKTIAERVAALVESRQVLEKRVTLLALEKETLQKKLDSLPALKQAIKELKEKQQQEKQSQVKRRDQQLLAAGNRGFVVRGGETTLQHRGTVEVIPAPLAPLAKDGQI